jgi:hypothetical protein
MKMFSFSPSCLVCGRPNFGNRLPQNKFDSDTCCWRKFAKTGEYQKAADLIVDYLENGKPQNRHSLNWHAGQLFAEAGDDKMALKPR